jgi:carboxyl-terminal processing protease
MNIFRKIKLYIIVFLVFVLSFAAISYDDGDDFELVKQFEIYSSLIRDLRIFYVDEVDIGKLIKTSLDKMLESLDPYTVYYPESQIEDYKFMTTGEYGGIGATVVKIGNNITITEPYFGYPAQKAGIRAGDIILKIQNVSVEGKSLDDVSKFLKGQPNSAIKMLIKRPGVDNPFEKVISRENIVISNVPYYGIIKDNIGIIKLTGFTESASKEFKDALMDLRNSNKISGLVIDLRDNPGGLLIEAVNIVNLFVDKGQEVVNTKGKVKQWNRTFYASSLAIDTKMPITVLVNRGSASASEIVAGSLQDLDRAVIIGCRTFGKGLVQTVRDLSYNTKFKVTTAKYYIPSGRCIQALDYSHRNEDGSVGKVPDSLISEFKTQNGRKVYDGGGVAPDILIDVPKYHKITNSLISNNLIFDFSTQYRLKHDSIGELKKFIFSEADYKNFKIFLKDKKVDYLTESEKALEELEKAISTEKYIEKVKDEVQTLKQKLSHNIENDLDLYANEIKPIIKEEIISRYFFQKGRIQFEQIDDDGIKQSLEILNDKEKYNNILAGGYKFVLKKNK